MDTLYERIEQGMTTARDARTLAAIVEWLMVYEVALRQIAMCRDDVASALARRALQKAEECRTAAEL